MFLQSDATLFESLRRLQLMQLSVSTLKVQNGYCIHELCGVSQCFVPWLLWLFGFLILGLFIAGY
jgi:hypothetical protein